MLTESVDSRDHDTQINAGALHSPHIYVPQWRIELFPMPDIALMCVGVVDAYHRHDQAV